VALLNPNFAEEGARPGLAAHWALETSTALEEIAGFDASPETAWEGFERWHAFMGDFDTLSKVRAFFARATVGYESFDGGWNNGVFVATFSEAQLELATLSPTGAESFDAGWSNGAFLNDWSAVASIHGAFDGQPVEDFEDGWRGNEGYFRDWSSVHSSPARFDGNAAETETFGGAWTAITHI
jgi:hypothetical protein